jgi:hypothetical protein
VTWEWSVPHVPEPSYPITALKESEHFPAWVLLLDVGLMALMALAAVSGGLFRRRAVHRCWLRLEKEVGYRLPEPRVIVIPFTS